ncbi:hypothetical protein [Flavobacterium piscis]|uniref:Uncharacterized protein n=1 Tax=Flavobacterium piscis TaxID=1114874 RepID=A0ABU1YDN0_9FLAO|nr:hypothetical protein [Flavobacterium piscis]MDR7212342.1 hypothetical protein [Flavobacterium piscis]
MIAQVEEAEKKDLLSFFYFTVLAVNMLLNVDLEEHRKLLEYLKKRENDIWVASMVEVAKFIKEKQTN